MPSYQKKVNPAAVLGLSTSARAARKRKGLVAGEARATENAQSDVRSLDYAIAHPNERVVVQGPKYAVIIPELKSSKISDGDLKRLLREIAK